MSDILFYIVILITNMIQAITGFAGTLLAMPPSILLVGVGRAKVVLNLLAMVTCLVIVLQNRKSVQKKILAKILVFMAVGMGAGTLIFKYAKTEILLYLYGIMIIVIAIVKLFKKSETKELSEAMSVIILLTAGVIHGMFVSGGALLVVYAACVLKDKDEFRATVASVWVFLNTLMLFSQAVSGMFDKDTVLMCALSLVPAFAGVWLGNRLHHKISGEGFMKLTYILLFISGVLCFI